MCRLRLYTIVFIVFVTVSLLGCKEQDMLVIDASSGIELQHSLYDSFASRKQVISFSSEGDAYRILFGNNRVFLVLKDRIPLISISDSGYWVINEKKTGCNVGVDTSGLIILPSISLGEKGTWLIDNQDTGVIADNDYYYQVSYVDNQAGYNSGMILPQIKISNN